MTRPIPEWRHRAPVEPVTHEPQPSGLLEAWSVLAADGPVRLADLAQAGLRCGDSPSAVVRTIADALDTVRPTVVTLSGVVLECGADSEPAAYRWPRDFLLRGRKRPGGVEDCTVLAALAVGVALWGRLPTADEVSAWMDEDEPVAREVG